LMCYTSELAEKLDIIYEGLGARLASEFYIPLLKGTKQYSRVSGYFSVDSLVVVATGLAGLIRNGGVMRLIVGLHDVSPELIEAYKLSREKAKEILEEFGVRFARDLESVADEISRRRIEALAWMLVNGTLEVKVALPKKTFLGLGNGIFHEKLMIFKDFDDCIVAAVGSANETRYAYEVNGENLTVHMSWREGHLEYIRRYMDRFEALWEDRHPDYVVFNLPEVVEKKLREKFYPPVKPELDPLEYHEAQPFQALVPAARLVKHLGEVKGFTHLGIGPLILYPHQIYAVDYVLSRFPHRAILADEVGLGKTIEAGAVIKRLIASGKVQRVLILAPKNMTRQWLEEMWYRFGLRFWLLDTSEWTYVSADGSTYKLDWSVNPFDIGGFDLVIASWHYVRGSRRRYPEVLTSSKFFDLVVIDEAHHARRKRYLGSGKIESTRLYELVSELSITSPHILLLTATPIQLSEVEAMDLLSIIGIGGPWVYEELFETYFRVLRSEPSMLNENDILKSLEMAAWVADQFFERGELEKVLSSLIGGSDRRIVDYFLRGDLHTLVKHADFDSIRKLLLSLNPLQLTMVRNTRDKLMLVGFKFPERDIKEEPVELAREHKEILEMLDRYLREGYGRYEKLLRGEARTVVSLVKSVYHQRFVSSFTAAYQTVVKRLEFLKSLLAGDREALARAAASMFADVELEMDEDEVIGVMEDLLSNVGRDLIDREIKMLEILEGRLRDFSPDALSLRDPKLRKVASVVKEFVSAGHKVLVFSKYTDTVDAVVRFLVRGGFFSRYEIGVYTGEGGKVFREDASDFVRVSKDEVVRELEEGSLRVLVCSDAASEGLNLQAASVVVNVDMPWNPAKVEQRIGRVDRLGQKARVVYVRNVWYPDSIEAEMYRALFERRELYNIVVGPAQEIISDGLKRALDEGGTYESIRKIVGETLKKVDELKQDIARVMGIFSGSAWIGEGYEMDEVVYRLQEFIFKACRVLGLDIKLEGGRIVFNERQLPRELRRWNGVSVSVGGSNALTPAHPIVKWICDEVISRAGDRALGYSKSVYLVRDSDGLWRVKVVGYDGGALEELDPRNVLKLIDELLEVGV
jgi:superfamily II DNA or RNA helicase